MDKDRAIINFLQKHLSKELVGDIRKIQAHWNDTEKNISETDTSCHVSFHKRYDAIYRMKQDLLLEEYKDNKRILPNLLDDMIIRVNEEEV
tara:strand:- start:268 stop:540 length:273 start_codon:yes stop_codon:yes gene_type:complete